MEDFAYLITIRGKSYRMTSSHFKDFYSGYKTWDQNKLIGGGVKSFKYNCPKTFVNCSSHPHNYYLEILFDSVVKLLLRNFLISNILIKLLIDHKFL